MRSGIVMENGVMITAARPKSGPSNMTGFRPMRSAMMPKIGEPISSVT